MFTIAHLKSSATSGRQTSKKEKAGLSSKKPPLTLALRKPRMESRRVHPGELTSSTPQLTPWSPELRAGAEGHSHPYFQPETAKAVAALSRFGNICFTKKNAKWDPYFNQIP